MGITVGIDTGGTFTDLVAVDESTGRWYVSKVPSNPENPVAAIDASLEAAGFDPADVSFVVVGTTIGINAVLTRRGARVVYLTTEGFEDVLHIQRINRKHHYDFHWRKPTPLAHRPDCIGVRERLDEEGRVLEPIDLEALARSLDDVLAEGGEPPSVAACFLFSYLNPQHELAARALLAERFPQLTVSLSHEVAPIWREYERGTTVTVDAYLKPLFERYVDGVSNALAGRGTGGRWALLKSNGGHAVAREARERPAHLLLSGIAGGAIGGAYAARTAGTPQAIALDMGGRAATSAWSSTVSRCTRPTSRSSSACPSACRASRRERSAPAGGSIGWVDPGGFLQVGPQSGGRRPRPGLLRPGRREATITDADVVLGRLDPSYFLGGKMALDAERRGGPRRSRRASGSARPGRAPLGDGAHRNENMANAIRIVTVGRGIDPREFALVAIGGAGATHACEIGDAINMRRVVVPPRSGLCSAFGALAASARVDAVRSVYLTDRTTTAPALDGLFGELEAQALADVAAQGLAHEPTVRRFVAMRYQSQNYEQEVAVPAGTVDDDALAELYSGYGRLYEEFYGYRLDGIPIELVRLSVVAMGEPPVFASLPTDEARGEGADRREVFFPATGFVPTDIVRRDLLVPSETRPGPLVVESMDSTVVVPPGWSLTAAPSGILDLTRA